MKSVAEQIHDIYERMKIEKKKDLDKLKSSGNLLLKGTEIAYLSHLKSNAIIEFLDAPQEQKEKNHE